MALLLLSDPACPQSTQFLTIARTLETEHHLLATTIFLKGGQAAAQFEQFGNVLVLEDFELTCEASRPSALRFLTGTLQVRKPTLAICGSAELFDAAVSNRFPSLYLYSNSRPPHGRTSAESFFQRGSRIVFNSSADFHSAARWAGFYPTKVALRPWDDSRSQEYVKSLFDLARGLLPPVPPTTSTACVQAAPTRKIVIPCSDWALSGVNSSLEAIGRALIARGWQIEIVFTRAIGPRYSRAPFLRIICLSFHALTSSETIVVQKISGRR